MTNPRYSIRLGKSSFNANIACLGENLTQILKIIKKLYPKSIWYLADVDTNFEGNYTLGFGGWVCKYAGISEDIIKLVYGVDQFFSGVFLAFTKFQGEILVKEFSTEDPEFRDIGVALLEIRAFDTSYFEIYSNDFHLIQELSKSFLNSKISENK